MRGIDSGATGDIKVALYVDCDEGVHLLPKEDLESFEDRVHDPFPERKNGRFGATVILYTDNPIGDPTLTRRALQKAKHLIGLERQRRKLAARGALASGGI